MTSGFLLKQTNLSIHLCLLGVFGGRSDAFSAFLGQPFKSTALPKRASYIATDLVSGAAFTMADADYAPMEYDMEGAEQQAGGDESDSDEVINQQADEEDEDYEEPSDSKDTEEPEVRMGGD
jgi:hypothetical protein